MSAPFVVSLEDIKSEENLGEKANRLIELKKLGFDIPQTFFVKPEAYFEFLSSNNLVNKISHLLNILGNEENVIKKHLKNAQMPVDVISQLINEYRKISGVFHHTDIVLQMSNPHANSRTLKLKGESALIAAIKDTWTNLPSPLTYNPALIIQKIPKGKNGKIRTSTKLIMTSSKLSEKEKKALESFVENFRKNFFLSFEIGWVINMNKIFIIEVKPETGNFLEQTYLNSDYRISPNSYTSA